MRAGLSRVTRKIRESVVCGAVGINLMPRCGKDRNRERQAKGTPTGLLLEKQIVTWQQQCHDWRRRERMFKAAYWMWRRKNGKNWVPKVLWGTTGRNGDNLITGLLGSGRWSVHLTGQAVAFPSWLENTHAGADLATYSSLHPLHLSLPK